MITSFVIYDYDLCIGLFIRIYNVYIHLYVYIHTCMYATKYQLLFAREKFFYFIKVEVEIICFFRLKSNGNKKTVAGAWNEGFRFITFQRKQEKDGV